MRATREMLIGELVQQFPKAAFVMQQYGFHCAGCAISQYETLEQGARTHGMSDEELDEMLEDLNLFLEAEQAENSE